jgi:hypothetical protein
LRQDVSFVGQEMGLSERRACRLLGLDRSSYRHEAVADADVELRRKIVEMARQKPRYGYRQLHAVLVRRSLRVFGPARRGCPGPVPLATSVEALQSGAAVGREATASRIDPPYFPLTVTGYKQYPNL